MGFRFRKSIKLMPRVRLNLSKSGVSTSVGVPGSTVNFGPNGTRHTVGLPGSGLSFSTTSSMKSSENDGHSDTSPQPSRDMNGCGCLLLILGLFLAVAYCGKHEDGNTPPKVIENTQGISDIKIGDTVFVTAKSLNARTAPSTSSVPVSTLHQNETVQVMDKKDGWIKIAQGGALLWVAAQHVSNDAANKKLTSKPKMQHTSQPNGLYSSAKPKASHSKSSNRRSSRKYKNGRGITNGSCPCNGGAVCVGPRGGRYCITRSGNKRYGV
jgi:uncharacterized protein YgiM (DUF1202 family)